MRFLRVDGIAKYFGLEKGVDKVGGLLSPYKGEEVNLLRKSWYHSQLLATTISFVLKEG